MKGLIGYFLHSYTVSQRFFGPVAGIMIAVLILYSYKPNPVMSSYSATAVLLFVACAWLGLSFLNHEQAVQKQVVIVQLRSARRYSMGGLLTMILLTLLLDVVIVIYPVLAGSFQEPAGLQRILLGLAGHALMGLLGITLSLYLQSSWVPRAGYAAGMMLILLILSISAGKVAEVVPGPVVSILLPPVYPVMDRMMNAETLPVSSVLGAYAHALAYIILLAGFYIYRSGRMDYNKTN
ncbi:MULTISPECIES: hypothetical protein [unclassified Paenibacillus]|uniref:hypothetical protein n=1 Tax=unclassified Paenibacillus TaxID=185978 RepID=UPI0003E26D92|nr:MULTISPECIES: hypothetical protein [unclassified Paenibacillus]ETT42390.1 hypothetical protein C162_25350 [Paenibacillus sp. FSL R7-269]OMF93079.1 hypothetical protein BK147_19225 [Paenibacillus sp. FSL R7-0337]